jgi:carbon storage regulator
MESVNMDIVTIPFESKLILIKNNHKIQITVFLTEEQGNVKIGIDAPRGIGVDREEIYIIKQNRLKTSTT